MATVTETPYSDLVPVRLVYDPALGSPVEMQPYGGILVSVPPSALPLPQTGRLFTLRGYSRQIQGIVPWEWVLQGDVDPVDQFVDSLTGRPDGWVSQADRSFVKLTLQQLFSAGIPRATLADRFPQLYNAIRNEVIAEQGTPSPVAVKDDGIPGGDPM